MKDKYDEAIEHLTEHPERINKAWYFPNTNSEGCLFQFVSSTGEHYDEVNCLFYGCLTSVKNKFTEAYTEKLTKEIRADERIPNDVKNITIDNLHVFAEWQRRIDKELNKEN